MASRPRISRRAGWRPAMVEAQPPTVDQARVDADRADPAAAKAMRRDLALEGRGTVDSDRRAVGEESRLHQVAGVTARDAGAERRTCAPVPVLLAGAVA